MITLRINTDIFLFLLTFYFKGNLQNLFLPDIFFSIEYGPTDTFCLKFKRYFLFFFRHFFTGFVNTTGGIKILFVTIYVNFFFMYYFLIIPSLQRIYFLPSCVQFCNNKSSSAPIKRFKLYIQGLFPQKYYFLFFLATTKNI